MRPGLPHRRDPAAGKDPEEDAGLEEELRADPKEKAEHVMLVDLGRNDLGRVCAPGSVHVPTLMTVERYRNVMHLVSTVTGRLREDVDTLGALEACFPAGTVSGAPKIRAMEIIEELEAVRRGAYAGAIGTSGLGRGVWIPVSRYGRSWCREECTCAGRCGDRC